MAAIIVDNHGRVDDANAPLGFDEAEASAAMNKFYDSINYVMASWTDRESSLEFFGVADTRVEAWFADKLNNEYVHVNVPRYSEYSSTEYST